jgi:hypothetical protein
LLEERIAVTPVRGRAGDIADRLVRFFFSTEPIERVALLVDRVRGATISSSQ